MKRSRRPNVCVLWKADEEIVDHLFLGCPFSGHIWEQLAHCLWLHIPQLPKNANLFWSSWRCVSIDRCDRVLRDLSATATIWGIWREWNNKIFNDSARSSNQTFCACFTFISYWINIISGRASERARRTLEQTQLGDVSDRHFEEMQGGGHNDDFDSNDL